MSIASNATVSSDRNIVDQNMFGADDDYYDDDEPVVKADFSGYGGGSVVEDIVQVEEEEGSSEEEGDDEEEGEGYETDEEDGEELDLADEYVPYTPSQEELRRQREFNKQLLKEKKQLLIDEYLQEMKHFSHVRAKNTFLMLKIASNVGKKQEIIDKYTDLEKSKQEQRRNSLIEKTKRIQEKCGGPQTKFQPTFKSADQQVTGKYHRKKKRHTTKRTMFEDDNKLLDVLKVPTEEQPLRKFILDVDPKTVPSVTLNKLREKHEYNVNTLAKHGATAPRRSSMKSHGILPFAKQVKLRQSKKIVDFSFRRSKFMKDMVLGPTKEEQMLDLKLGIEELDKKTEEDGKATKETYAPHRKSLNRRRITSSLLNTRTLSVGKVRTGKFAMTEEAVGLSKSKARMRLDEKRLEQKVRLDSAEVTTENLNQFKFEFADPRLTAKQASTKIRSEFIKLLKLRHIPTNNLKWPMEIKGVNFSTKNPYGRVALNYTRPTMKESEHPYNHYKMLLTNIAYLRTKQERMMQTHNQNMLDLEEERVRLSSGVQRIINEIVEGLRIWASLSGYSSAEKRIAMKDTEKFIEYVQEQMNEKFFSSMLIDLYREIISTEFALRRLSVSEGKGEGAELHEFKDIMRCREKLKAEHITVQQSIEKYQDHSKELLQTIRSADSRKQELVEATTSMTEDLKNLTTALSTMIDAMYFVLYLSKEKIKKEMWMRSEIGLHGVPSMIEDYKKTKTEILNMKYIRAHLQRQYNACHREIYKRKSELQER